MNASRVRPDFQAGEQAQSTGRPDMQRAVVHWKCEGLTEADTHRAVLPGSPLMTMAGQDEDWRVDGCARSDEIGANRDYGSGSARLRWTLLHMIEETARHAGHADTVRELPDGRTGCY